MFGFRGCKWVRGSLCWGEAGGKAGSSSTRTSLAPEQQRAASHSDGGFRQAAEAPSPHHLAGLLAG